MASYVGLNVGGKLYRTSHATLTLTGDPPSFFTLLLSGRIPSAKDEQGNYLIDRDGKIFRHILNFLRCRKLVLPEGFKEHQLLKCEAEFYQIENLRMAITKPTSEAIGLKVGGRTFMTTRETLSREPNSLFTDILGGRILACRDVQGFYVIGGDGENFPRVLEYLRSGFVVSEGRLSLGSLREQADFYRLEILKEQIKSINRMQAIGTKHSNMCGMANIRSCCHFDMYYYEASRFCIIYTHTEYLIGSSTFLPLTPADFYSTFGDVKVAAFTLLDKVSTGSRQRMYYFCGGMFPYPNNVNELYECITRLMCAKIPDNVDKIQLDRVCTKIVHPGISTSYYQS